MPTVSSNPAHRYTTADKAFWPCFREVVAGLQDTLEVGCAEGYNLLQAPGPRRVGIEIYQPYVDKGHCPGVEYLVGDALEILPTIPDKSFDLVLLIDIIEHFDKAAARTAMAHADRIARRKILAFLPDGFMIQDEHLHDDYREWSEGLTHRSGWTRQEMEALGYDVAQWDNYHNDYRKGSQTVGAMFCVKELL